MAAKVFTGGDKLQARLREIAAKVTRPGTLEVGFFEDARYPDGTSVAMVAAINEFGAPNAGIPPRPFFRNMIAENNGHWGNDLGAILKAADYDAPVALGQLGQELSGELVASIDKTTSPGNAESTIAQKGFDRPLVDTGFMRQTAQNGYRVKS